MKKRHKKTKPNGCAKPGVYKNMSEAILATGSHRPDVYAAKKLGFPGFKADGRVDWNILGPEIEARMNEVREFQNAQRAGGSPSLKEEIQKRQIQRLDLDIEKRRGQMLNPDEMKKMLVEWAVELSAVIKKEFDELIPRIVGKSEPDCLVEKDKSIKSVFKTIKSGEIKLEKLRFQNE